MPLCMLGTDCSPAEGESVKAERHLLDLFLSQESPYDQSLPQCISIP